MRESERKPPHKPLKLIDALPSAPTRQYQSTRSFASFHGIVPGMRKKRTLLICTTCALLAILALLAYKPPPREPSYDGHPLSYWVASVGRAYDFHQYEKATNAFDHIGPAALPFLVKWVQYNPPRWRFALAAPLNFSRFQLAQDLSDLIANRNASYLAGGTFQAFQVLRERAMPAFDDMYRLMNQTNSLFREMGLWNLSCLGPRALPPLLAVATNAQQPRLRSQALNAIAMMPDLGDAAQMAVPALVTCLGETNNPSTQVSAIGALGNLKASPQISIPALVSCLNSKNARLREYSATALGHFGPKAISAIPALTNALADSDRQVHEEAAHALHEIDPTTFTDTPPQKLKAFPF
jgi:hypothetical protein